MAELSVDRYAQALTDQTAQFAALVEGADLGRWLPSCPGWDLRRLVEHVGQAHRFAAGLVERRATGHGDAPPTSMTSPGAAATRPDLVAALRGTGQTLHLQATDQPGLGEAGEWITTRGPEGVTWAPGHGQGDVAVRGPVVALLLVLLGRVPMADPRLEMTGDAALLEHWLQHVVI